MDKLPFHRQMPCGSRFAVLADAAATGGTLSVVVTTVDPTDQALRQVHHREDQAVIVLRGHLVFRAAGKDLEAGPGDLVYLPRGLTYRRLITPPGARLLTIAVPAGLEGFLSLADGQAGTVDAESLLATASEHGVEFLLDPVTPEGDAPAAPGR